ncbi:FkbM family methyltransferase [Nonomuraea typhae]|uniref:FkbM family methyltransferase n=1 Tax=Nonomuraea typhae TaxID=2603600 RepID=A0ABW7Z337_9ACTN
MSLRRRLAVGIMRAARAANRSRVARTLLRGRSVRRLPLVNVLYQRVFRMGVAPGAVVAYRGVRLSGPAWDNTIMPSISGGYYEEFEVSLFEKLAGLGGTVVDVGANIGVYACAGGARMPSGRLLAFEPVPENLGHLRANVERNDLAERVEVAAMAVGAAEGTLELHLSAEQSGKHSADARNAGPGGQSVTVPMTTLDAYLDGRGADLIKIDVEGYEGFVLRGAAETLAARPALLFELHPELQANCGFAAGELLDLVYDRYPHVYLIDELRNTLVPCERAYFDRPGAVGLYRANVVAAGRTEHLEALRPHLAG